METQNNPQPSGPPVATPLYILKATAGIIFGQAVILLLAVAGIFVLMKSDRPALKVLAAVWMIPVSLILGIVVWSAFEQVKQGKQVRWHGIFPDADLHK